MKTTLAALAGLVALTLAGAVFAGTEREEDPCRDREPTELDALPQWRCVGLATFHPGDRVPEPEEPEVTEEALREADRPGKPQDDLGVAVAPDGRLYVQVRPMPGPHVRETGSVNPEGREDDPEGEPADDRPRPGGRRLAKLIGADDRVLRLKTTAYPWRALGAILPQADANLANDASNCSGVLIGPRHVLTAGHCLFQNGAWFPNVRYAPGMRGIGTFPNGVKSAVWYFAPQGWWKNGEKSEYDYALLIIANEQSTASLGWFGWKSSGHSGGVWTFGYPAANGPCAASPAPPTCSNFMYGDDGSIVDDYSLQLTHNMDTQKGQSGSPVYKYNGGDRRVIAVHKGAVVGKSLNVSTRITSTRSSNICKWMGVYPSSFASHECT